MYSASTYYSPHAHSWKHLLLLLLFTISHSWRKSSDGMATTAQIERSGWASAFKLLLFTITIVKDIKVQISRTPPHCQYVGTHSLCVVLLSFCCHAAVVLFEPFPSPVQPSPSSNLLPQQTRLNQHIYPHCSIKFCLSLHFHSPRHPSNPQKAAAHPLLLSSRHNSWATRKIYRVEFKN